MAFATANVQTTYWGNLNVTYGDWSGSIGDSAGSFTVKGGRVYLANFTSYDNTSPQAVLENSFVSISQSGSTTTLTVNYTGNVTNGRFIVVSR